MILVATPLAIGGFYSATPSAPARNQQVSAVNIIPGASRLPNRNAVHLSRPPYDTNARTTAESLVQECLDQLYSGPSVQADFRVIMKMEAQVASLVADGEFYSLGRGTGLAKMGIQLPGDSEMAWVVSREETCIQTIPSALDHARQVTQQPDWFASTPEQSAKACYGSPISLLQWAMRHFHFEPVQRHGNQVTIEGQLRPQVARGWGDGTTMPEALLKASTTPRVWLVDHVVFPLPHRIRLTFSDQPQTARTLQEFSLYRFDPDSESAVLLLESQWLNWQLATGLTPQDFPRETILHQTAGRKNPLVR